MPPASSPKLGAAYIRYSSNMQDDSFSLEAQERQIAHRAGQESIQIVQTFADPATSAYSNKYRPGIEAMLEAARQGKFEVLYVHKVDRLARRLEWAIEIVRKLQSYGVNLKAVEQNFDLATPEGKLMFHLLSSLGEFYSDNLSKETHKGKYERAMQGYHNGWTTWGYTSEQMGERKLAVPDPQLVPLVKKAFEMYATGLYYDQQIADWINEQGVKTRKGRKFTKDTVREILQNPFYIGYVRFRGTFVTGKPYRSINDLVKGLHQPIVDEDIFQVCQAVRASRRSVVKTSQITRRVYLLSGLLVCDQCGRRLRAQSALNGKRYYRDVSRLVGTACVYDGRSVRAEIAEEQVSDLMQRLRLPVDWQKTLETLLHTQCEGPAPDEERAKLRGEIRRMRESFKRGLYEGEEHVFWREIESLQARLAALEQVIPLDMSQAAARLVGLREAWLAATNEERHELVQIVLAEVRFDIETGKVVKVKPKPEYAVLFELMESGIHLP
jgi:site-specific DNA recombinase